MLRQGPFEAIDAVGEIGRRAEDLDGRAQLLRVFTRDLADAVRRHVRLAADHVGLGMRSLDDVAPGGLGLLTHASGLAHGVMQEPLGVGVGDLPKRPELLLGRDELAAQPLGGLVELGETLASRGELGALVFECRAGIVALTRAQADRLLERDHRRFELIELLPGDGVGFEDVECVARIVSLAGADA